TEGAIRKQILMASKTGRTWLDCKNPQMADHFLRLAVKSLETLYSQLMSRGDAAADVTSSKADVEKDLLRILSCQAESAVSQGNSGEATVYMQRCKDMLQRIPKDTAYLSLMCYNFGVDTYNLRKFEDNLRLLATVYLEWDCQRFQEKALDAVILANKCVSTSGLYLKIRILLRSEAPDNYIRAGLDELLESQVPLEVCLSAVKLLMSEDRLENKVLICFPPFLTHNNKSPEPSCPLLLQRNKELLAKQKIEDIITGHYSGKQLTPDALTSLHVILWDQASKHFEAGNYAEALQWYNYSFSFFKAGQMEPNLAKLQRNRASCLLHLQQLEKAKEAIKEAERSDPESIFTQFCIYKIAVQDDNVQKGMCIKCRNCNFNDAIFFFFSKLFVLFLCNSCRGNGRQETAMKALEVLCENSKDEAHVLKGLSLHKPESFLLPSALQTISHQSHMSAERHAEDANWFRKIAWNSALQCESRPDRMRDFFVLSYQLSLLCPPDRALLMGQRTSLLMAAAASLELCRKSPHSTQAEDLTVALEHIQACWEVCKTLKASGTAADPTDSLLLLYEFEARAKLSDPKVETILESVLELEHVETKVLETMAGLAMEPPAHFPQLCKKALRAALSLHRKQPQADPTHCSKYVHSLIKLSLPSGVSEVESRVLQELWDYFEDALSIISATPDGFPEMETLWLLTQAWNAGILLYSLAQYHEAEKWCGLAMSFIRHLGSLRESYETQVEHGTNSVPYSHYYWARICKVERVFSVFARAHDGILWPL
uniref:Protein ZIP4 homolog n=1 Tax=Poecilia reticulata TaxID=8081 RepID=A0A3P9NVY4_POERE